MIVDFRFLAFRKAQQGNNTVLLKLDWFPSSDSMTQKHPLTFVCVCVCVCVRARVFFSGKPDDGQSLDAK